MELSAKTCIPCRRGTPTLARGEVERLSAQVPAWSVSLEPPRLSRQFTFLDFKTAMAFVGRVAEIAEAEDHHPDIAIHFDRVELNLWTHAVGGLTENDFIVAAKIDRVSS